MDAGPVFTTLISQNTRSAGAEGARFRGLDATHFAQRSYVAAQPSLYQERDGRMTGTRLAGFLVQRVLSDALKSWGGEDQGEARSTLGGMGGYGTPMCLNDGFGNGES